MRYSIHFKLIKPTGQQAFVSYNNIYSMVEMTSFLSCPSSSLALKHGGFVPFEWLVAKGWRQPKMLKNLTLVVADTHIHLYMHVRDTSVSHLWTINSCSHLKRSDWWLSFILVLSAIKILCGDYGVVLLHNLRSTFRRWENLRVKIFSA